MAETPSNQGVYFLSLTVENVRCFAEKQTLDLSDGNGRPAQWTVILGDNGTGKSTLLDILRDHDVMNFGSDNHSFPRGESGFFHLTYCYAFGSKLGDDKNSFKSYCTEVKPNPGGGSYYPVDDGSNGKTFRDFDREKCRLFTYGANRKFQKYNPNLFNKSLTNDVPLDFGELINAEEWLLQVDYIANKNSDIQSTYQALLTRIKETLIALLPDVTEICISTPSKELPFPRVLFKTLDDCWLVLSQLSMGYQTMTAWMVDLAAQLFKHYPNSPNPIAEPAVVLIDEIDLHLHPKWQRTIMAYLSERFVNTQFIVTAHSPLIVQSAENANIVVLKREGDSVKIHQHPQDVKGWRIDQLLTSDLFDLPSARSPHYENLLNQRRQILSQAQLTAADQAKLTELESQIGELPTAETREDIDAMSIIRRAAELLK